MESEKRKKLLIFHFKFCNLQFSIYSVLDLDGRSGSLINFIENLFGSLFQEDLSQFDPERFRFLNGSHPMMSDKSLSIYRSHQSVDVKSSPNDPCKSRNGNLAAHAKWKVKKEKSF